MHRNTNLWPGILAKIVYRIMYLFSFLGHFEIEVRQVYGRPLLDVHIAGFGHLQEQLEALASLHKRFIRVKNTSSKQVPM